MLYVDAHAQLRVQIPTQLMYETYPQCVEKDIQGLQMDVQSCLLDCVSARRRRLVHSPLEDVNGFEELDPHGARS
jgi:hypothetical protein